MKIQAESMRRSARRLWIVATISISYTTCLASDLSCNSASWHGAYVVDLNGFRTSQAPPQLIGAYFPVAVVGTFTFDAVGNVRRAVTVSAGGLDIPVVDSGTYSVNRDCSGTAMFSDLGEAFSLVAIDSKNLSLLTATPGESGTGTLVKQQVQFCESGQLKGTYVFNGSGWASFQPPPLSVDAFFPVAVTGYWIFDGKGFVSRNLNLSFFGFTFLYQDSGAYKVNSDCTGSAYFTSDTEPFAMILADNFTVLTNAMSVPGVSRVGAAMLTKQHPDD